MFNCVLLELVVVYWLTVVVPAVKPICLTWKITDSFLTISCIVPITKRDIFIVDPLGNIRGQCILRELQHCLGSFNDDLLLEENFEEFKILTLKTDRHNAEGEWKCQYGLEEKTTHVSYTEGIGSNVKVGISGEIRKNNSTNMFILSCFSCWTPDVDGVNIDVNGVWEDGIRYHEDLCYHKRNKCRPKTCSCSAKGKNFTWTYKSDLPYIKFTCVMRFKDTTQSLPITRQASLVYNGSVFTKTQTKNMSTSNSDTNFHNLTIDVVKDDQNYAGIFGYTVTGIVSLVILAMLCFCQIYVRRKKKAIGRDNTMKDESLREIVIDEKQKSKKEPSTVSDVQEDRNNQDEMSPLIDVHEDKNNQGELCPMIDVHEDKNNQGELCPMIEIGEDKKSDHAHLIDVHEDKYTQDELCPLIDVHQDKNNPDELSPMIGKNTLSQIIFWIEDLRICFICSNTNQEKRYTINLINHISKCGFQPKKIKLINDVYHNYISSELATTVQKLVIIFPREDDFDNTNSIKLVETAWRYFKYSSLVEILQIVRSEKACLPGWLNKMKLSHRSELELIDVLLHCQTPKTMNSLIMYQNRLNEISFSRETCKHVANIGLGVLKGWGVDLEKERMSFRLKILKSSSQYEPICVYDLITCFAKKTSISFLRFYVFKQRDLGNFKFHPHMHKQFKKIFKTYFGTKLDYNCWYHYRRNGFRHRISFEEYLRSIFLNKTHSVIYQHFEIYETRLESFENYPIENKSFHEKLAFAGFFYFDVSDYVQCFYCKGCLRAWNIMDDPLVRHREHFKTCPFIMQADRMSSLVKKRTLIQNYTLNELKDRINSFKSFPVTILDKEAQQLAEAGFYYCGIALDIICLACNIGFADLQNVDDIVCLHKKYSPECPNIVLSQNNPEKMQKPNQEGILNFARYLEFEVRKHASRTHP